MSEALDLSSRKRIKLTHTPEADLEKRPSVIVETPKVVIDQPIRTYFTKVPLSQHISSNVSTATTASTTTTTTNGSGCSSKQCLVLYIGEEVHKNLFRIDLRISNIQIPYAEQLLDNEGRQLYPSFDTEFNRLELQALDEETSNKLIALLPQLYALEININRVSLEAIPQISRLLEFWSSTLKTLKFRCHFIEPFEASTEEELLPTAEALCCLINAINKLPVLKHLTLIVHDRLQINGKPSIELSILDRLSEFYFYSIDRDQSFLLDGLIKYGEPNERLKAIGIGNIFAKDSYLKAFSSSKLRHRFVMLNSARNRAALSQEPFIDTFSDLQTHYVLGIEKGGTLLIDSNLAPLTRLLYLTVAITEHPEHPELLQYELSQLECVKVLRLMVDYETHAGLHFCADWGHLFPSVQIILVVHQSFQYCTACKKAKAGSSFLSCNVHANFNENMSCLRKLIAPLKQCPVLRKVYYYHRLSMENPVQFNAADL